MPSTTLREHSLIKYLGWLPSKFVFANIQFALNSHLNNNLVTLKDLLLLDLLNLFTVDNITRQIHFIIETFVMLPYWHTTDRILIFFFRLSTFYD